MTDPPIGAVADPQRDDPEAPLEGRLRCDFCGEEAATVHALLNAGWAVSAGERFRIHAPPAVRITCATLRPQESQRLAADLAAAAARTALTVTT